MISWMPLLFLALWTLTFSPAYGDLSHIPFEECSWKNKNYTHQILNNNPPHSDAFLEAKDCSNCSTRRESLQEPAETKSLKSLSSIVSQAILPPDCFFASSLRATKKGPGQRKFYYCDSPEHRNQLIMSPIKDPSGKIRHLYPRRPCLNEDYTKMTHKAFHSLANCFNFSPQDKIYLFALLNHESSFILNNRSRHRGSLLWTNHLCHRG